MDKLKLGYSDVLLIRQALELFWQEYEGSKRDTEAQEALKLAQMMKDAYEEGLLS